MSSKESSLFSRRPCCCLNPDSSLVLIEELEGDFWHALQHFRIDVSSEHVIQLIFEHVAFVDTVFAWRLDISSLHCTRK